MATPISPSVQDSLQTLDARVELNLLEVLAKSYGEGFVKAVEGMEAKPQIKKDDSRLLKEDVARMTRPIQDYNKALAGKVDEMVRESFAAGKDDMEVARILRARIPEILNNEPITIQRPGKRPVTFTAEEYADMVANVVPYAVRNEGYIRGLKEAGADGWQSVAVGDERMCPMCGEKHGQVYGWDDPKPPYHVSCRCRPVAYFRKKTKEEMAESERIKAWAEEKPWETPGTPAESPDEVAEALIDDIIPEKMAYPGSKIERPKLDHKVIKLEESETTKQYIKQICAGEPLKFMDPVTSEDLILSSLAKEASYDKLPKLVSGEDMDKIIAEGHIELYRGVSKPEFAKQFQTGSYYAGKGFNGNGIYAAIGPEGKKIASRYAGSEPGCLISMALDKDAKIITDKELKSKMKQYLRKLDASYAKAGNPLEDLELSTKVMITQDPGRWATLQGYDAIYCTNNNEMIVLNRGALYVTVGVN